MRIGLMSGKSGVVVGASSGIGEAAARLFAQKGANVVLVARRKKRIEAIADDIQKTGGKADAVLADVLFQRIVKVPSAKACCKPNITE